MLAAKDMHATAQFYRKLGLEFDQEHHGDGPWHLAHTAQLSSVEPFLLEIYQDRKRDAVLLYVTKVEASLDAIDQAAAQIRSVSGGLVAIARDPDGRAVVLFQQFVG